MNSSGYQTRSHRMPPGAWPALPCPPSLTMLPGWLRSQVATTSTLLLVEGAGGLLVRIDANAATIADLGAELKAVGAKVGYIVVAAAGLGTLNHSALTAEALRSRGLDCLGFVIGSWPDNPDLAMRTNLQDLAAVTGAQLLGRVPAGAGRMNPIAFQANAAGWIAIA